MIICWLIGSVIGYLIITTLIDGILVGLPIPNFTKTNYPLTHIIVKENRFDVQKNFECSAYSSAYLLRHFGFQANGEEMYKIIPNKMKNGYVYPKGIVKLLKLQGFKATFRIGSIAKLKDEISKDTPVMVLIKVFKNKNYLHYVPVVGYDEENLYIAESLKDLINTNAINYNRKITISEFRKLWKISDLRMPLYKNTYFSVCRSAGDKH